jgi:hypothetical protein
MAAKLTILTHKIAIQLHPSGRELYHLQFSLQAASPETFGYILVHVLSRGFPLNFAWRSIRNLIRCLGRQGPVPCFTWNSNRSAHNRSHGSSINRVTRLQAARPGFDSRYWQGFFSSPPCLDQILDPTSNISNGYWEFFPEGKAADGWSWLLTSIFSVSVSTIISFRIPIITPQFLGLFSLV